MTLSVPSKKVEKFEGIIKVLKELRKVKTRWTTSLLLVF